MAVAGLIGTEQYYRTTADAVYYQSIFEDVVASIGGSIGAVIPYNGSSLRLNNLFFIGGDTLRGFEVGGIGPRDAITTDALGGTYFYTGTSELSFPLGLPKEIGILGKAFVDVGSLWGLGGPAQYSNTVLTSNTMRVSTGLGIQWISPFGPIRIDYAFPLVAGSVGQDRELPLQLRHALLRGRRCHEHPDRQDQRGRRRQRWTSSGSCR